MTKVAPIICCADAAQMAVNVRLKFLPLKHSISAVGSGSPSTVLVANDPVSSCVTRTSVVRRSISMSKNESGFWSP